jgi:hypothetical protein
MATFATVLPVSYGKFASYFVEVQDAIDGRRGLKLAD